MLGGALDDVSLVAIPQALGDRAGLLLVGKAKIDNLDASTAPPFAGALEQANPVGHGITHADEQGPSLGYDCQAWPVGGLRYFELLRIGLNKGELHGSIEG
jgi:hypothetical protein